MLKCYTLPTLVNAGWTLRSPVQLNIAVECVNCDRVQWCAQWFVENLGSRDDIRLPPTFIISCSFQQRYPCPNNR